MPKRVPFSSMQGFVAVYRPPGGRPVKRRRLACVRLCVPARLHLRATRIPPRLPNRPPLALPAPRRISATDHRVRDRIRAHACMRARAPPLRARAVCVCARACACVCARSSRTSCRAACSVCSGLCRTRSACATARVFRECGVRCAAA